jgi:hypothetical protein
MQTAPRQKRSHTDGVRVQIRSQQRNEETWWRITEADGALVDCWLPWEGRGDPLDKGGFAGFMDARSFSLGLDWIRASAGLLDGVTTADIDRERAVLDEDRRGKAPAPLPHLPTFEAA